VSRYKSIHHPATSATLFQRKSTASVVYVRYHAAFLQAMMLTFYGFLTQCNLNLYRKSLRYPKNLVYWSVGIIIMVLAFSNGYLRKTSAQSAKQRLVNIKGWAGSYCYKFPCDTDPLTFRRKLRLLMLTVLLTLNKIMVLLWKYLVRVKDHPLLTIDDAIRLLLYRTLSKLEAVNFVSSVAIESCVWG
jgi:hypothetical protein